MTHGEQNRIALTGPQADCLIILRSRSCTIPKLAIEAKIAINKARITLRKLTELGLTEQDEAKLWTATANGNILPLRKRSPINLMAARWDPAPSVCWPCWIGRYTAETLREDWGSLIRGFDSSSSNSMRKGG